MPPKCSRPARPACLVILAAALAALALAACGPGGSASSTLTPAPLATPTAALAAASLTPLAIWTPTASPAATAAATASPAPSATATAQTATPTALVTATPLNIAIPTLVPLSAPATPVPGQAYHLRVPDPETLLAVIPLVVAAEQQAQPPGAATDATVQQAQSSDAAALDNLIKFDVQHYYSDGMPSAAKVFGFDLTGLPFYDPPASVQALLPAAALNLLNSQRGLLVDDQLINFGPITALPLRAHWDAASADEWLVQVDYPAFQMRDWLPLRAGPDGAYHLMPRDWAPIYVGSGQTGEIHHADLTGDHQEDVILARWQFAGGFNPGQVTVYRWDGSRLAAFSTIDLKTSPLPTDGASAQYELADHDQDGLPDIQVVTHNWLGPDCSFHSVDLYTWRGGPMAHVAQPDAEPATLSCAIENARLSADIATRQGWFETALARLAPADSADLRAWLDVRLAEGYAALGREADAAHALSQLAGVQGSGVFADLARRALTTAGPALRPVCDSLYSAALQQGRDKPFGSAIDEYLVVGGYPVSGGPYPGYVCPMSELVAQDLQRTALDAAQPPDAGLAALGYPVLAGQALTLTGQAQPVWLGVPRLHTPLVLAAAATAAGRWQFQVAYGFDSGVESASWATYTANPSGPASSTGPATPLLAALLSEPVAPGAYPACPAGQRTTVLVSFKLNQGVMAVDQWTTACGGPELASLATPADQARAAAALAAARPLLPAPPRPAWVTLDGLSPRPANTADVFAYVAALQTQVISQTQPGETQSALTVLLAFLPPQDPAAQLVASRVRYLEGLNEELSGQGEAAVAAYLDLIRGAPASPWSRLAWARMSAGAQ